MSDINKMISMLALSLTVKILTSQIKWKNWLSSSRRQIRHQGEHGQVQNSPSLDQKVCGNETRHWTRSAAVWLMSKSSIKGSQRLYALDESYHSNKPIRYLATLGEGRNASRWLDRSQLKAKTADGRVQWTSWRRGQVRGQN